MRSAGSTGKTAPLRRLSMRGISRNALSNQMLVDDKAATLRLRITDLALVHDTLNPL
jgi:hypothetical protein